MTLRPETEADRPFLRRLYGALRADELAMAVDWTEEQKEAFIDQQFTAQSTYYREHYKGAEFFVVEDGGEPVGRFYLHHREKEIRLMDISFLPAARGRGLGSSLLADLLARGEREGKSVTIHVEKYNPALRLYERLGFQSLADRGVYWLLEWVPPGRASISAGGGAPVS
jgi:ribosomal protein S18 acetylase RimI-like enzyme